MPLWLQLEQVKLSQVEAGRQAENDREAREALWQKLQEANQKLSDASRDALGREAELEQRLGMAEYGQQMIEAQSSELHVRLQQRGAMLQVRPAVLPRPLSALDQGSQRYLCTPAVISCMTGFSKTLKSLNCSCGCSVNHKSDVQPCYHCKKCCESIST